MKRAEIAVRYGLSVSIGRSAGASVAQFGMKQRLSAADRKEENACPGKLVEQCLDLGGVHFAIAVVLEIAMFAPFVTAVRHVKMHA